MMSLKTGDIIRVIEEYRRAYWEHRDPGFVKTKRYSPIVSHDHKTTGVSGGSYTVSLYDTWIDVSTPGRFMIGRNPEPAASCTHKNLQLALEELLNFTRIQFTDDNLFRRIRPPQERGTEKNFKIWNVGAVKTERVSGTLRDMIIG